MRRYTIEVNGKTYMLDVHELSSDSFEVTYEDRQFDVLLVDDTDLPEAAITPVMSDSIGSQAAPAAPVVRSRGAGLLPPGAAAPAAPRQAAPSGAGNALTAPMPGVILSIDVKAGARVKRGDVIGKLEAMKMVNPIRAPKDTVVAEITVSEGQMVAYGDALSSSGSDRMNADLISRLLVGVNHVTWQSLVMLAIAGLLFYLAIVKDYEPLLLIPIGAGCLLANLPLSPMLGEDGLLTVLYNMGITNEMFPLLIFVGIGALTDFGPLLENPKMVLIGAAGQFGIFGTLLLALALGFTRNESASIGDHRRHRRPHLHLCLRQARPAHAGPDHGGRLQLHVAGAHHHAAHHAPADHEEGAPDPHALQPADHLPHHAHPLPHRRDHHRRDPGALRHAAHRDADARQLHEGIRGRGAPDQGLLRGDRQRRDPVPGPGHRLHHGGHDRS